MARLARAGRAPARASAADPYPFFPLREPGRSFGAVLVRLRLDQEMGPGGSRVWMGFAATINKRNGHAREVVRWIPIDSIRWRSGSERG